MIYTQTNTQNNIEVVTDIVRDKSIFRKIKLLIIIIYIFQLFFCIIYTIYNYNGLIYYKDGCYLSVDKFNNINCPNVDIFNVHKCNLLYCNYMKQLYNDNNCEIPTHYSCTDYNYLYAILYIEINITILYTFAILFLSFYVKLVIN